MGDSICKWQFLGWPFTLGFIGLSNFRQQASSASKSDIQEKIICRVDWIKPIERCEWMCSVVMLRNKIRLVFCMAGSVNTWTAPMRHRVHSNKYENRFIGTFMKMKTYDFADIIMFSSIILRSTYHNNNYSFHIRSVSIWQRSIASCIE